MKKLIVMAVGLLIFSQSLAFAKEEYRCFSSGKNKKDGYFYSGNNHGVLLVGKNEFILNVVANLDEIPIATYVYKIEGVKGGNGAASGMLEGKLDNKKSNYTGDSITPVYIDESLQNGGDKLPNGKTGGRLVFAGWGYAWDWNFCFSDI